MIPAKYYEEVEERLRKDAERLQRRLHLTLALTLA